MGELTLISAARGEMLDWAQAMVKEHHYLHAKVDQRCTPFAYVVELNGERVGCLIFGRPEATRCYAGKFTYGSFDDVQAGRAKYDRWEVLNLARVWLDPRIQQGGEMYIPKAASTVIKMALEMVGFNYLEAHPPVDCRYPYQIRCVLSYCDTRIHSGYVYMVSRFKLARMNKSGIQTWIKPVGRLGFSEDLRIRFLSIGNPRSRRIRMERERKGAQLSWMND